jgi:hypothetical protein
MNKPEKHSSLYNSKIEERRISTLDKLNVPLLYDKKLDRFKINVEQWRKLPEKTKVQVANLLKEDAKIWLSNLLAGGPMRKSAVRIAAQAYGISKNMLSRAARSLGVVSTKEGNRKNWRLSNEDNSAIITQAETSDIEINDDIYDLHEGRLPWE